MLGAFPRGYDVRRCFPLLNTLEPRVQAGLKARLYFPRELARETPPIGSLAVERHPPGHSNKPGAKPCPIAQLIEASIGFRERFLGDVLGIFPLPEHAEGDPESQPGGIRQSRLELTLELQVGRHEAARKTFGVRMHQASPGKTPQRRGWFTGALDSSPRSTVRGPQSTIRSP